MEPKKDSPPPAQKFGEDFLHQTGDYARQEPIQALGVAFVTGLALTLLPIGSIVAALVRLTLGLVRPALLVLGAMKIYEEINQRQQR